MTEGTDPRGGAVGVVIAGLLRNWPLILLFVLIGLGAGFAVSTREHAAYTATARVSLATADTQTGTTTADTARAIVTGRSELTTALAGTPRDVQTLANDITVRPVGTSAVVEISVRDSDPNVASLIANNLAAALVRNRQQEVALPPAVQSQLDALDAQIAKLNSLTADLDGRLQAVNAGIGTGDSGQLSLQAQVISDRLSELSSERSILVQEKLALQGRQPSLPRNPEVVDAAVVPTKPDLSRVPGELGLGALAGLILGAMVAAGRWSLSGAAPRPVPDDPGRSDPEERLGEETLARQEAGLRQPGSSPSHPVPAAGASPASSDQRTDYPRLALTSGGSWTRADSDRIPFSRVEVTEDARRAVENVFTSGWLTTGPEVLEFEREFGQWVGADEAIAVSSCTAAIEISLRALQLPPGSRVLTSAMTFAGAVHAILHAGLRPVLVDINPMTLMPDEGTTAAAVRHAGRAEAMVALHYGGRAAPVAEMAEAAGLGLDRVVEDAAHALGTWVGDTHVGTKSAAGCFSFYATKNLPIGEGGMITTNDRSLAAFMRRARLHGMSKDAWRRHLPGAPWEYDVDVDGLKANMTDLGASVGRANLHYLDSWQERRTELAHRYDGRLLAAGRLQLPQWPTDGRHAWHLYVVRVLPGFGRSRDEVIELLRERGIDCSVHFKPISDLTYFQTAIGPQPPLPMTDEVAGQVLSLPLYPGLADAEVDRVCYEILSLIDAAAPESRLTSAPRLAVQDG